MSSAAAAAPAAPPVAPGPPVPAPVGVAGSPVAAGAVEPISVRALMFVLITALLVAVASLIDVFVNGWLSALAHLAWAGGVFVVVGLLLGLVVSVISQLRRAHAAAGTSHTPVSPTPVSPTPVPPTSMP